MRVWVRVKAVTDQEVKVMPSYYLAKMIDYADLPIPVAGDTTYIDGVFLDVTGRCISPRSRDDVGDYRVELYTTAPLAQFTELEDEKAWERD